jgi:predicted P-loop ATPase
MGAAALHPFHPVRDYLTSQTHDEEPRLQNWLSSYLGVEPTEYTRAIGPKWLISAVARIMKPGCQVDTSLCLEGPQGKYKSSSLRVLASDQWFTDQIGDIAGREASSDLPGKWIVEFSDLRSIAGSQISSLNSFMTRRTDHYRPTYGRNSRDFPRQCVFAVTTNQSAYLQDETGNRRWWPVICRHIDIDALRRDRDQIWAEAYAMYQSERPWWIEDDSVRQAAVEQQSNRLMEDPWTRDILKAINAVEAGDNSPFREGSVSIPEILKELSVPVKDQDQAKSNRVARCLVAHSWKRYRDTADGRPWRYRPPD